MFPDADEDVLCDVFGVVVVAEHFADGADDGVFVAFDELAEGGVVAERDFFHQTVVDGGFCIKWSCAVSFLHLIADGGVSC